MMTEQQITARKQLFFWGAAFLAFLGFVALFNGALLPFVLGAIIAYLLDPVIARLQRFDMPRWSAALFILAMFFNVLLLVMVAVLPFAYRELEQLVREAPVYLDRVIALVSPYVDWLEDQLGTGGDPAATITQAAPAGIEGTLKVSTGIMAKIASGGQAVAGFFAVLVMTPVVAFFMMKDWPRMTSWIDQMLPRGNYATIKDLLHQIDRKLAGFIRGQLTIGAILAVLYSSGLSLIGLNFGLLIGLTAGFLSIIPYVGSTFGLVTSLIVAWFQEGSLSYCGMAAAVFAAGQVIETYFLTPRLLGKTVGLHPLWILFAVLAGGTLLGLVGMLLAVPTAAVIGVLGGHLIKRYRESAYYQGPAPEAPVTGP